MFALLICICLKKAVSLSTLCQKNKNVSFFRTHLYVYSESRGDLDTNTIQCSNYMARRGHRTSRELSVRLCVLDSASCCQGARRRSIKSSTHLIELNHGFSRIFFYSPFDECLFEGSSKAPLHARKFLRAQRDRRL